MTAMAAAQSIRLVLERMVIRRQCGTISAPRTAPMAHFRGMHPFSMQMETYLEQPTRGGASTTVSMAPVPYSNSAILAIFQFCIHFVRTQIAHVVGFQCFAA